VNYAALSTAIQDYTQNYETSFVANIPTFVQQAEERIYNTVLLPALRRNVTATINAGFKYLSCPDDFLAVLSLSVTDANGNQEYLLNKDVSFIRSAYPKATDTGIPQYYALFGPTITNNVATNELSFIIAPAPDTSYTTELHYFYYPESIVTAGTSWVGDNYDPVLLYGSLVEAYIFMKGEQDMMTYYETKFKEALSQLVRLGAGLEQGDTYRDTQYKVKVAP
jgi:hypothetical protein